MTDELQVVVEERIPITPRAAVLVCLGLFSFGACSRAASALIPAYYLLSGAGDWSGTPSGPLLDPILGVVDVVSLFAFPFLCLVAFTRQHRIQAIILLMLPGGVIFGVLGSGLPTYQLELAAYRRAVERAEPVVNAVHRFAELNNRPPASLRALMPEFLSSLPAEIPDLEVYSGSEFEGNTWYLRAHVPSDVFDLKSLLYVPRENYDAVGIGRWTRIGDWAFLHEYHGADWD